MIGASNSALFDNKEVFTNDVLLLIRLTKNSDIWRDARFITN